MCHIFSVSCGHSQRHVMTCETVHAARMSHIQNEKMQQTRCAIGLPGPPCAAQVLAAHGRGVMLGPTSTHCGQDMLTHNSNNAKTFDLCLTFWLYSLKSRNTNVRDRHEVISMNERKQACHAPRNKASSNFSGNTQSSGCSESCSPHLQYFGNMLTRIW